MKNSLRIHKWTHNEFNIFILGVLTHPHIFRCKSKYNSVNKQINRCVFLKNFEKDIRRAYKKGKTE